jgi:hypothetical protein
VQSVISQHILSSFVHSLPLQPCHLLALISGFPLLWGQSFVPLPLVSALSCHNTGYRIKVVSGFVRLQGTVQQHACHLALVIGRMGHDCQHR